MPLVPFARQTRADPGERGYSGERLLNMFLRPTDGVADEVVLGRSGFASTWSLGAPVREMTKLGDVPYAAAGGAIWKLPAGAPATAIGGVADDVDTTMAADGAYIAIVAGGKYHVWDGTTMTQPGTGAITKPAGVAYLDGFFIIWGDSGGRSDAFAVSAADDPTSINALDFAFAEKRADKLLRVAVDHGQLWMLGTETVEVFYNSGNTDFPFARNTVVAVDRGCLNGRTAAVADNSLFWVDGQGIVQRAMGADPQVISTREIDAIIANGTVTGGFVFMDRGHMQYALSLKGRPTMVFDMTTSMWHERSTGLGDVAWDAVNSVWLSGAQYIGTSSGHVGTLSDAQHTDNGTTIDMTAVSMPLDLGFPGRPINMVEAVVKGGTGGLGRTPQAMLQTTHDGESWSNERWRSIGVVGEHYKRARWHGLGRFERFQVRIRMTDPVPRDLYGVTYA